jgi:hypothetical protein
MINEFNYDVPVASTIDSEIDACKSTSEKIRLLTSKGLSRSQIAAKLNIRYQHVRNVQITPTKKA